MKEEFDVVKGHYFYYSDDVDCGCWGNCGHWQPACRRCGELFLDYAYITPCDVEDETEQEEHYAN